MNSLYRFLIKTVVLALICLTAHAQSEVEKIIGADSSTDLSANQLLGNINPRALAASSNANTGYEHLKGKIILYVMALYNGSSQVNGAIRFSVSPSGKIQGSYNLNSASVVSHDYDYHYKYMNGRSINNLTTGAFVYHYPVGYGPDYGVPYDGMVALDNVGASIINTESISFPPYMSATVTPAGMTVEFNGELTGIYHTTFIPWPKNRMSQAWYIDNDYESRVDSDDYVNSLFFVKDLK